MGYEETIQILAKAGIPSPRLEARLLIGHILGIAADSVSSCTVLTDDDAKKLQSALKKRLNHTPLDKILGYKEFYKYTFTTSEDVLSPRPDTEILLEAVLKNTPAPRDILDLGTGSGCLALSLLKEYQNAHAVGVDISQKALNIAIQNAQDLGVSERFKTLCANWFAPDFLSRFSSLFDLIVSNPPYIPTEDISSLSLEVQKHDPFTALDGGKDGLNSYKRLAEITPCLLQKNGFLALEAGINQALSIQHIFENAGLKHFATFKDLSGIERTLLFQK